MLRISEPRKEEEFLMVDVEDYLYRWASFGLAISRHQEEFNVDDGQKEARSILLTPFSRNAPAQDPIPPRSFSTSSSPFYSPPLLGLQYVIFARR